MAVFFGGRRHKTPVTFSLQNKAFYWSLRRSRRSRCCLALSSFTVQSLISEHLSLVHSLNAQRSYYGAESMLGVLDQRPSHDL